MVLHDKTVFCRSTACTPLIHRALEGATVTCAHSPHVPAWGVNLYVASDDVSQAELLAFWRQVRRVDWNVPFLMVLNDRLPHRQAMLRYGYDSAVEVSEGIIAIRSAAELLLQASEGRVLDALAEEERTISHEIMERLAALDSRVERSREAVARAAEHQLRAMAYDAFDAAGGTRSHFEKLWPDVFNNLASEKRDRRE